MKKVLAALLAVTTLFLLGACGQKKEAVLRMYDGTTAETKLMYQMVKLLVEEHTDLPVELGEVMSSVNIYKEMQNDKCDLVNSYDGTVLTTFLHLDMTDVPPGETMYDFVNRTVLEQEGMYLLDQIGTNNTYALAMPQALADQYNISTISQLAEVAGQFVFGAEHEFFSEEGMAKFGPFSEFYGLEFKDIKQVDVNLKYAAVENGSIDVVVVYTTDGLNKKAALKVLEDDRSYFPAYNGALLVRADLFDRVKDVAPNLEEVLNKLAGFCSNEEMTDMSYAVDVEERSPGDVAREFLQKKGLIA